MGQALPSAITVDGFERQSEDDDERHYGGQCRHCDAPLLGVTQIR